MNDNPPEIETWAERMEKYGDALVCVRYRYDEASRTRIKTVELIVDKKELTPSRKGKQKGVRENKKGSALDIGH
jgi:hypothetical protein